MREVYVMAVSCTAFGKRPSDSFKDLTREAYLDVLDDAGWENGDAIEQAWFGIVDGNFRPAQYTRAGLFHAACSRGFVSGTHTNH